MPARGLHDRSRTSQRSGSAVTNAFKIDPQPTRRDARRWPRRAPRSGCSTGPGDRNGGRRAGRLPRVPRAGRVGTAPEAGGRGPGRHRRSSSTTARRRRCRHDRLPRGDVQGQGRPRRRTRRCGPTSSSPSAARRPTSRPRRSPERLGGASRRVDPTRDAPRYSIGVSQCAVLRQAAADRVEVALADRSG